MEGGVFKKRKIVAKSKKNVGALFNAKLEKSLKKLDIIIEKRSPKYIDNVKGVIILSEIGKNPWRAALSDSTTILYCMVKLNTGIKRISDIFLTYGKTDFTKMIDNEINIFKEIVGDKELTKTQLRFHYINFLIESFKDNDNFINVLKKDSKTAEKITQQLNNSTLISNLKDHTIKELKDYMYDVDSLPVKKTIKKSVKTVAQAQESVLTDLSKDEEKVLEKKLEKINKLKQKIDMDEMKKIKEIEEIKEKEKQKELEKILKLNSNPIPMPLPLPSLEKNIVVDKEQQQLQFNNQLYVQEKPSAINAKNKSYKIPSKEDNKHITIKVDILGEDGKVKVNDLKLWKRV